jgi:hypothetical protein
VVAGRPSRAVTSTSAQPSLQVDTGKALCMLRMLRAVGTLSTLRAAGALEHASELSGRRKRTPAD